MKRSMLGLALQGKSQDFCVRNRITWKNFCVALSLLGATVCCQPNVQAENIVFPADAGIIDVSKAPYNLSPGSDATTTTQKLQQAINDAAGGYKVRTVYLPNGTYYVNNTLYFKYWSTSNPSGAEEPSMTLQGQSRAGTVIQLVDNASGFNNTSYPKAIVATLLGPQGASGADGIWTYTNFAVSIQNLSIAAGNNNPGAIGLVYLANNCGAVRDVSIWAPSSSGWSGIDMKLRSQPGPAIIQRVHVDGFQYGVDIANQSYSMVFDDIRLYNQRTAGLRNTDNSLSIRKLESWNANNKPIILNQGGDGLIVLDKSNLNCNTGTTVTPIQNNSGHIVVRDSNVSGNYPRAIQSNQGSFMTHPSGYVDEFISNNDGFRISGKASTWSLWLPVNESPNPTLSTPDKWVNVRSFGAVQGDANDDADAIQRAIDSMNTGGSNFGKDTLYFPNTSTTYGDGIKALYRVSRPIEVRGNVKRIIGLWSSIGPVGGMLNSRQPIFRINNMNSGVGLVTIEQFASDRYSFWDNDTHFIQHNGTVPLLARDLFLMHSFGYRAGSSAGDVYLENFHALWYDDMARESGFSLRRGQKAWMRQINPEKFPIQINNLGATAWILGFKTEYGGTAVETKDNGATEILGGYSWTGNYAPTLSDQWFYVSYGSRLSASLVHTRPSGESQWNYAVRQQNSNGSMTTLSINALPLRNGHWKGHVLPLFSTN